MTEKLIDDAVQAFEDCGISAPPREHLRVALTAFDASLSKCGCEACTVARRERIALTDHDRTAVARALHEIVYSPGANFDRAVPGIQEYMLKCAEKVVAALPWIAPHTPTDDAREAHRRVIDLWFANWRSIGKVSPALEVAIDSLEGMVSDALDAGFRRSEVPEPSAEQPDLPNGHAPIEKLSPFLARRVVDSLDGPTVKQEAIALLDAMNAEGRIFYADYSRLHDIISQPQGEPSDAQVLAAGAVLYANWESFDFDDPTNDWERGIYELVRAALRAAGGEGR